MDISICRFPNNTITASLKGQSISSEKPPIEYIILLDKSGSMSCDNRFTNAIRTLICSLDFMDEQDLLSIILFGSDIERPISRIPLTSIHKTLIQATLQSLKPDGATNLSGALSEIHFILEEEPLNTHKKYAILLTDGEPTTGITKIADLVSHIHRFMILYPSLTLTAVGIGEGHNAPLLQQVAQIGNGSYNIVNNLEQVATVFGNIMGSVQTCVAQQVRLIVPSAATQLTKFTERIVGTNKEIVIGDVIANGELVVVLEGMVENQLTVKYVPITTGVPESILVDCLTSPSPEQLIQGKVAILRCQLAAFVIETNRALNSTSFMEQLERLKTIGSELLTRLQAEPKSLMIEFLIEECKRTLEITTAPPPPPLLRSISNQLSQHSSILSTGRGVVSSNDEDPSNSIFSSPVQIRQATALRSSTSEPPYPDTPYPHSTK